MTWKFDIGLEKSNWKSVKVIKKTLIWWIYILFIVPECSKIAKFSPKLFGVKPLVPIFTASCRMKLQKGCVGVSDLCDTHEKPIFTVEKSLKSHAPKTLNGSLDEHPEFSQHFRTVGCIQKMISQIDVIFLILLRNRFQERKNTFLFQETIFSIWNKTWKI